MSRLFYLKAIVIITALLAATGAMNAWADLPTAQFMLVGHGPRAEAMGQAVVATCFDYTAAYWNPAAMVFMPEPELGADYTELFKDSEGGGIKDSFISFVFPYQRFAYGFRYISEKTDGIKTYDSTGLAGNNLATVDNNNMDLLVAYQVTSHVSVGIGVGTTNMTLIDKKANALSADLGVVFKQDKISAGAGLANFGSKLKFTEDSAGEDQESIIRAGIAYTLLQNKNLLVAYSYEKVLTDTRAGGMGLGFEYLPFQFAAFRVGVRKQNDDIIKPSFGWGLKFSFIYIDYSFTMAPAELLGVAVHRLGAYLKFGNDLRSIFNRSESEENSILDR
ncbi:MAG: PorV/PorQ family protein [Elusimicrobia bacterium]|nr:PorV/PorQ family protein [Elusimicrobiota bacterium]